MSCKLAAEPEISSIFSDPSVRFLTKAILNGALKYDSVDAIADVELAAATLRRRLKRLQAAETVG